MFFDTLSFGVTVPTNVVSVFSPILLFCVTVPTGDERLAMLSFCVAVPTSVVSVFSAMISSCTTVHTGVVSVLPAMLSR